MEQTERPLNPLTLTVHLHANVGERRCASTWLLFFFFFLPQHLFLTLPS